MEDDTLGLRVERRSATHLLGEMKLDARFFLLSSVEKAHAFQVGSSAARKLQERRVVSSTL